MNRSEVIQNFLRDAPSIIDAEEIVAQWRGLLPHYEVNEWQLPLPLWAQRPYDATGPQAWSTLQSDLLNAPVDRPLCIYLHIPFCVRKCGFCDSYSFRLHNHVDEHIKGYIDHLCAELALWSTQGSLSHRPISTIHLGGGTPAFIGEAALTRLVECCHKNFAVSASTEWALETTVSSLTRPMISALHALGFRRLHLGVQTLEPTSRQEIGRISTPVQVLATISTMRSLGWVVSVDLLCGLPFQTLPGFIAGIQDLIAVGTNGFSLYELLVYPQNMKWAQAHDLVAIDHLPNYLLFQAGAQLLAKHAYRKNLFNHWADSLDANTYFTFPTREEDCLAAGTIADGVFANYHYRHPRYSEYLRLTTNEFPGLEGGLRRTNLEEKMHPWVTAISSARLDPSFQGVLQAATPGDSDLLFLWLSLGLFRPGKDGLLELTDCGSWFAGNIIADMKGLFPELEQPAHRRSNRRMEKRFERWLEGGSQEDP